MQSKDTTCCAISSANIKSNIKLLKFKYDYKLIKYNYKLNHQKFIATLIVPLQHFSSFFLMSEVIANCSSLSCPFAFSETELFS